VKPFGTTTLSWECVLPTNLRGIVTLTVAGHSVTGLSPGPGGTVATLSGSTSVTLYQTTQFGIAAAFGPPDQPPVASRAVVGADLTVQLSDADCKSFPVLGGLNIVAGKVKQAIDQALQGRLLGNGSTVTPSSDGFLSIAFSMNLNGQGSMDVSMELWIRLSNPIQMQGHILVTALNVTATVHLSGLASVCEDACSQVAQAFMTEIANNQVAPGAEQGLNDLVQQFALDAHNADPLHRTYVLTSLVLSGGDVTFTLCPTN
jgi:hypothetical protein